MDLALLEDAGSSTVGIAEPGDLLGVPRSWSEVCVSFVRKDQRIGFMARANASPDYPKAIEAIAIAAAGPSAAAGVK
jgi:hypothetical protein